MKSGVVIKPGTKLGSCKPNSPEWWASIVAYKYFSFDCQFSMIYILNHFNKWDRPRITVLFDHSNDDICVFFIGLELPFMMMPHPLIPVSLPPASVTMAMSQMNHLSTIANMAAAAQVQSPPSRVETSVIKVIVFSHDCFGSCQTSS